MTTQTMDTRFGTTGTAKDHTANASHSLQYRHLAIMIALSFVAMYILMYAMVNTFSNVFNSINEVYMAGLMSAPMAVIELFVMRSMYKNRTLNAVVLVVSVLAFAFCWFGIRKQIGVGDNQFVRSMIPHHSGAILMCNEASIEDVELKNLCAQIVKSQQDEINQMKSILARLSK